ncbi:MAG: hypothetical protein J0H68_05455 [Sphingobacteriia bacterium]|nr:hypothetical protein [Sphingobacteriia bacterium]
MTFILISFSFTSLANNISLQKKIVSPNLTRIILSNFKSNDLKVYKLDSKIIINIPAGSKVEIPSITGNGIKNIEIKDNKIIIILEDENYRYRKFLSDNFLGLDLIKELNTKPKISAPKETKNKDEKKAVKEKKEVKKEINHESKNSKVKNEKKIIKIKEETKKSITSNSKNQFNNFAEQIITSVEKSKTVNQAENPKVIEKTEKKIVIDKTIKAPILNVESTNLNENFVKVISLNKDDILTFEWNKPVSAAVFKRSGFIYIVFNESQNIPLVPTENTIGMTFQVKNNFAIYKIKSDKNIKINRESTSWIITLTPDKVNSDAYEMGEGEISSDFNIFYQVPGLSNALNYVDQIVGDDLTIFTVDNDTINVEQKISKTDFEIIPTSLGIVVLKKNDSVKILQEKNKIILDSPSFKKKNLDYQTKDSFFNFGNWRTINNPNFKKDLEKLFSELTFAESFKKTKIRLKIVDFFLTNGMPTEALSALKNARFYEPILASKIEYKVLEALLYFLDGEHVISRNLWNDINLAEIHPKFHNEIKSWITAANLTLNDEFSKYKINYLENRNLFMSKYPNLIKQQLALIELNDLIDNKDYKAAENLIEVLNKEIIPQYKNDLTYYTGLLAKEQKDYESAQKTFKILTDKKLLDPKNRARAIFDLTKIEIETNKITKEEAIKKLSKLDMVWRGDFVEAEILELFGRLNLETRKFVPAFQAWQTLVDNFPNWPGTINIATELSNNFVNIFNGEMGKGLSDLELTTIFFEFRELIPIGKAGDQIVQTMINKMIVLDLLDQASILLEHQVKYRTKGDFRTNLISQLAFIYVLDNKPEKAIETLKLPLDSSLTYEKERERMFLLVKALIDAGKETDALNLTKADLSTDASAVRAEIYWRNKNWTKLKEELNMLTEIWAANGLPLDSLKEKLVIKLAVAQNMLGNLQAVEVIKKQFYDKLNNPFNKKVIDFILEKSNLLSLRDIDKSMGLDTIQFFLEEYKKNLVNNYNLDTSNILN